MGTECCIRFVGHIRRQDGTRLPQAEMEAEKRKQGRITWRRNFLEDLKSV